MTLRLYDTARRAVVPFEPPHTVSMYVCGITPYDSTHLGHAATYLTYDILIRRLEDLGHEVKYVRNVTDVDDSILPKARELGVPYLELAEAEMARFHSDMDALEMRAPDAEPRATESIDLIIELIGQLLESGNAYLTHGTAYFDVSSFPRYGELSHYSEEQMIRLARARGGNPDDPHRRQPLDFVLWQPSLPDEPAWRAPFGVGRPGWHIECSAMSMHEHGPTIDLHGGGTDLIFPHHESRDRAEREPHGQAVRHALVALGDGQLRGREDVEVARQPRVRRRVVEALRSARDPPRVAASPLPARIRVVPHRSRRGHRAVAPPARRGRTRDRTRSGAVRAACARRARRRPRHAACARRARRPRERDPLAAATIRTRTRCCWSSVDCSASTSSGPSSTAPADRSAVRENGSELDVGVGSLASFRMRSVAFRRSPTAPTIETA